MSNNIEMTAKVMKPEDNLCRCCHSKGSFKSLHTAYFWLDVEKVVYSNVLRECFNIELLDMRETSQQLLCAICYTCIQRLEDAVKFKRQIQKCEKLFQKVYSGCLNKDSTQDVIIKEEILDPEEPILFESTDCPNGDITSRAIDNGDNASDEDIREGDIDFNFNPDIEIEEDISKQVGKRTKCKKAKTAKVKKNNKIQKKPKPVKEEEVLDVIKGIKVRRRLLKRGVDFSPTDEGYQCSRCPIQAKTTQRIKDHINSVHLDLPKYKCPICSKGLQTLAQFTRHKLEEHDIDHRLKCNACDSAFNTKIQLQKHKNIFHMLGVKIKCQECDYETFSVESLYKHKFKHKTVKDFKCKYCKKAFLRKATLRLHERIHTGDRRKVCAVCGQAFVQKASLNYHMTKYHPEVAY